MSLPTTQLAERALQVLADTADDDGYVDCTGRVMAGQLAVSSATAARVLSQLVRSNAIRVVWLGSRSGPTRYRVLRRADPDVLREAPGVAEAERVA